MPELEKLRQAFDGAKYVKVTDAVVFVWNGGHGIHVYAPDLTEIDYFSVGDFGKNEATLKEVIEGVDDIIVNSPEYA